MTIIAAAMGPERIAIAADTSTDLGAFRVSGPGKLHRLGRAVVGASGNRLFTRALLTATPLEDQPAEQWANDLAEHVHAWAKARGHGEAENGAFLVNAWWLVATPSGLFYMTPDGFAVPVAEPYAATGSGGAVAMGAMHALYGRAPEEVAGGAVRAAIAHADGCSGVVEVAFVERAAEGA